MSKEKAREMLDVTSFGAVAIEAFKKSVTSMLRTNMGEGPETEKIITTTIEITDKYAPELLDTYSQLYSEFYTTEEIEQLIAFYQTPLGQKVIIAATDLNGPLQQAAEVWSEKVWSEVREKSDF